MKKVLSIMLALVMCLGLCACGGGNADKEQPQTTATSIETTEPTLVSYWDTDYYVDSFGDSTGKSYMISVVDGTFSNTATTEADLKVCIYYSEESNGSVNGFSFRLLEYGNKKATYTSYDDITIQMKTSRGISDKYELYGSAPNGDIYADVGISFEILNSIKALNIDVRTIITIGSSTYKFTIPCGGFDAVYEEYKNMN